MSQILPQSNENKSDLFFDDMPKSNDELRLKLIAFRKEHKLATHAFFDSCGIDKSSVVNFENGEYGINFERGIKLIQAIYFGKVVKGNRKNIVVIDGIRTA